MLFEEVSKKNGRIITGFGNCDWSFEKFTDDQYVHIYNLFVEKAHRRRGHGRFILASAVAEIRALGYEDRICIVSDPKDKCVDKEKLSEFYESFGLDVYEYYG